MRSLLCFLACMAVLVLVVLWADNPDAVNSAWEWLTDGTASHTLNVIGVVLQALGLLVAAVGIHDTWNRHATEGFFAFVGRGWRRFLGWLRHRWTIIRGRRRSVNIHAPTATDRGHGSDSMGVEEKWPEFDRSADLVESVAQMHTMLVDVAKVALKVERQQAATADAVKDERFRLTRFVRRMDEALAEVRRDVSTEGLRVESFGLALVGLGLLCQGAALVV